MPINRVKRPSVTSRERVAYLISGDKRLIDMLGYAYERGIRDAAITIKSIRGADHVE